MPRIETVPVNEALADPDAAIQNPAEARLGEVVDQAWSVTSEVTLYGSYRRNGSGFIVPSRDEEGKVHEQRMTTLTPDGSIDDDLVEVEVAMLGADPSKIRWFLAKDPQPNPVTKRPEWRLLTFRAPEPTDT